MLKKLLQRSLAKIGFSLNRIRPSLPSQVHLKIFDLCVNDLMTYVQEPFVLQIGANDGVRADPIRRFVVNHKWRGLLIEPLPVVFEELKQNYAGLSRVALRNIAIAEGDGHLPFYVPQKSCLGENPRLSGLCSLSKAQVIRVSWPRDMQIPKIRSRRFEYLPKSVPTLLRDEKIAKIDVLQIDAEGYDWRILSQFDLDGLGVKLINMEFFHLSEGEKHACILRLTNLGYHTAFYLGDLVAYRTFESK